jgi:hypothetical protein
MKKITRISIASLLVVCVLVVSVSSVFASSSNTSYDPVATANGSATFSSVVLDISALPGTVTSDSDKVLPAGFTEGFAQFNGSGIVISGLASTKDTVNISFEFPTYRYGWRGSIYQWDGSTWVKVPTTIVLATDSNPMYYAVASKVGNGTYALIVGYDSTAE